MRNVPPFVLTICALGLVTMYVIFSFHGQSPGQMHFVARPRKLPRSALPDSCTACADSSPIYLHRWNGADAFKSNTTLVDFSCQIGSESYFHVILDCLAPISGLLSPLLRQSSMNAVHAYVPPYLNRFWPWFQAVMARSNITYQLINQPDRLSNRSQYTDVYQQACFSPFVLVQNRNKMDTSFPDLSQHVLPDGGRNERPRCKACFRDFVYELEQVPEAGDPMLCKYIIVISRTTTRRIINEAELVAALSRVATSRGISIVSMTGNESMPDVVHLFAAACAVVGYHGAGHTNTVFSRSTTLVLEVSTFSAPAPSMSDGRPQGNELWRSNREAVQEGLDHTAKWRIYYVGYEQLWPPLNQSFYTKDSADSKGDVSSSWDKHIKHKSVLLTRQDVHNIAGMVEAHLDDITPCIAGLGTTSACGILVDRLSAQNSAFNGSRLGGGGDESVPQPMLRASFG